MQSSNFVSLITFVVCLVFPSNYPTTKGYAAALKLHNGLCYQLKGLLRATYFYLKKKTNMKRPAPIALFLFSKKNNKITRLHIHITHASNLHSQTENLHR